MGNGWIGNGLSQVGYDMHVVVSVRPLKFLGVLL